VKSSHRNLLRLLCALLLCAQTIAASAQADGSRATLPSLDRVTVMATPKLIAEFELSDHNGKARKLSSFRGAPTLVFFGFTHCPDVCPAALTKLKLLHESNNGRLKPARMVLISVDGERDSPVVMKKYVASISPAFIGLTGDSRTVANIAARFSAVAFKEQPNPQGQYGYFHSSQIFLLDKDGQLRASFFDATVENMATVTQVVLDEK